MMNLSEVVVHTWDIATALGADATIDPNIAAMLDDVLPFDLARPIPRAWRVRRRDPRRLERTARRSAARSARPPGGVTAMQIQALGHVVLKVRDAQRAESFYGATLGIPVAGRVADPVPMIFFTLGTITTSPSWNSANTDHHPIAYTAGLAHVAFKVGDSLDEFDAVKRELEAAGVVILFELDHGYTKGMHMHDPDGNEVELYVDTPRLTETC